MWRFAAISVTVLAALVRCTVRANNLGDVRLVDESGVELSARNNSSGYLQVYDGFRWGFVEASEFAFVRSGTQSNSAITHDCTFSSDKAADKHLVYGIGASRADNSLGRVKQQIERARTATLFVAKPKASKSCCPLAL